MRTAFAFDISTGKRLDCCCQWEANVWRFYLVCPVKNREVDTGIKTESEFAGIPVRFLKLHCSVCGDVHIWQRKDIRSKDQLRSSGSPRPMIASRATVAVASGAITDRLLPEFKAAELLFMHGIV